MKDQSCEKKMQSLLIFDPCELLVFEGAASLALSYLLIQMWSTGSFLAVVGLTLEGLQLSWSAVCFLFLIFSNCLNCMFPECLPGQIV